eukprot:10208375-Alexandrium_andersonii.AAC.1
MMSRPWWPSSRATAQGESGGARAACWPRRRCAPVHPTQVAVRAAVRRGAIGCAVSRMVGGARAAS